MKFLCVPCDTPMRMRATEESEPGSLSVVYSCPACGYEMAMLTNQHETDMVRSLGVRIGPAAAAAIANPGMAAMTASGGETSAGRCPFGAMLGGTTQPEAPGVSASGPEWTAGALERLESIPEMVRPMARAGIEMVARENGHRLIDETVLAEARSRFGM
ncbi:MAG TPA: PCP reductase family protein [Thermoanaerobaculia bacterium]|nr:PCP reductase family protein [Thermoanaerobaculia bacterium]